MTESNDLKNWFILNVKPRCEIKVAQQLEMLGIKTIIPKKSVTISDKTFDMIIWNGKVFALINEVEKNKILQLPYIIEVDENIKDEQLLFLNE